MRALGAGDIKLFSVVSGIWNLKVICYCMFFSFLAGALVSLGKLLFYKNLGARLRYFCYYVWLSLTERHIGIYDRGISEKETIIHFSVAILIGFLISIGVII
jgi:prepilin peptidase CpaA